MSATLLANDKVIGQSHKAYMLNIMRHIGKHNDCATKFKHTHLDIKISKIFYHDDVMIPVALLYAFSAPCWIPLTKGKLCHLLLPEQTIEQWMTMAMKRHSLAKLYKENQPIIQVRNLT